MSSDGDAGSHNLGRSEYPDLEGEEADLEAGHHKGQWDIIRLALCQSSAKHRPSLLAPCQGVRIGQQYSVELNEKLSTCSHRVH